MPMSIRFFYFRSFGAAGAGARSHMASAAESLGAVQGLGHPGGAQPEGEEAEPPGLSP